MYCLNKLLNSLNSINQGLVIPKALCALYLRCSVRWRRRDDTYRLFGASNRAGVDELGSLKYTVAEKSSSQAWRRRNWDISGFRSPSSNLLFKSASR